MMNGVLSLVRCDFYIIKKQYVIAVVSVCLQLIFSVLIVLSLRYGNLSRIDELLGFEGETALELKEKIYTGLRAFVVGLPSVMCTMFAIAAVSAVTSEEKNKGLRLFMMSSPITPVKRALVHTLTNLASTFLSFGLICAVAFASDAILGDSMPEKLRATVFCFAAVYTVFAMLVQIFIIMFHDESKGYLSAMAVLAAAVLILSSVPKDTEGSLFEFALRAEPWIPLIIAGMTAVYFTASAILYGRREK